MKTVVICTHGLIKDAPHDFTEFKQYVEQNSVDLEVELLMLYDISNRKSFKYKRKCKRLEDAIVNYQKQGYKIVLVGYSFSCGLCAKMCKKYHIDKLIIVSPVIRIINRNGMKNYIKLFLKSLKSRAKATVNKKRRTRLEKMRTLYLGDLLFSCFYALHKTKRLFKYIKCPTLLMVGENDEIVYPKYLQYIHRQMKKCEYFDARFYQNANHVFIMSKKVDKTKYYSDMVDFVLHNALVTVKD